MSEQYRIDQSGGAASALSAAVRQKITITNELGLHARPAADFVHAARAFRSQIWIVKGEERFSAASIIEVLTANLNCGETATIEAEGADAEQAIKSLVELAREFRKRDSDNRWSGPRRTEDDF